MIKVFAPLQMDFAANILVKKINSLGVMCERVGKLEKDNQHLWIIYNSAMAWQLPSKFISYQTEQNGTNWFSDKYRRTLKQSVAVWEYCEGNLHEYSNPNTFIVNPGIDIKPKTRKDIDVLFYGAMNDRRKQALKDINCKIVTNSMGEEMRKLLSRTKTILNVHYYQPNCFETFRANEALSHNCNIVSEHSLYGIEPYKGIVKFGELHELKHLLTTVKDFDHNIEHIDNTEQIREALKSVSVNFPTFVKNKNNMNPQKYKLTKGITNMTFRAGTQIVSISKETQITKELYELCCKFGKSHCFDVMTEEQGQKKSVLKSQLPASLSTLNEVPTVEIDLNKAQEVKQPDASLEALKALHKIDKKKPGRPAKSKD